MEDTTNNLSKLKLLIVEDDQEFQEACRAILESDFCITQSFTFFDAKRLLRTASFDVVLLDLILALAMRRRKGRTKQQAEPRLGNEEQNDRIDDGVLYDTVTAFIHKLVNQYASLKTTAENVFYEIGYAHALKKEVVLLTQTIDDMPIDLRGFNCLVYDGKITVLREKLEQRMKGILSSASGRRRTR